ncbi:MAG: rhodanese-like domain-containing protein [Alphaproteobacteria bacterium]
MALKKGYKALLAEAEAVAPTLTVEEASQKLDDPDTVIVDIRDVRELDREGMIPGARHAPRGMIEFWVAPDSPYTKDWLTDESKTYVFYCQSAWRSALTVKDLMDMGATNVAHIAGGFKAWKEAGKDVAERPKKKD